MNSATIAIPLWIRKQPEYHHALGIMIHSDTHFPIRWIWVPIKHKSKGINSHKIYKIHWYLSKTISTHVIVQKYETNYTAISWIYLVFLCSHRVHCGFFILDIFARIISYLRLSGHLKKHSTSRTEDNIHYHTIFQQKILTYLRKEATIGLLP